MDHERGRPTWAPKGTSRAAGPSAAPAVGEMRSVPDVGAWCHALRGLDVAAVGPAQLPVLAGQLQVLRRLVEGTLTRVGEHALTRDAIKPAGCRDVTEWMGQAAAGLGVTIAPGENLMIGKLAEHLVADRRATGHTHPGPARPGTAEPGTAAERAAGIGVGAAPGRDGDPAGAQEGMSAVAGAGSPVGGRLSRLHDAVAAGEVSVAAASVIAKEADRLASFAPQVADAALTGLVDAAAAGGTRKHLKDAADQVVATYRSPAASKIEAARLFARRAMTGFTPVGDGTHRAEIIADPGSLVAIESMLHAFSPPQPDTTTGERDPRTPEQRRIDALLAVAGHLATTDPSVIVPSMFRNPITGQREAVTVKGGRARVKIMVDTTNLRTGTGTGTELVTGRPLAMTDVTRLCCDATLTPILIGTAGQPLAVGREERLATPAIRHALEARDHGCTFPGCHARVNQCDAHHGDLWSHGGHTRTDRMTLICGYHHTLTHTYDLTFTLDPDGHVTWNLVNLPTPLAPRTPPPREHRPHHGGHRNPDGQAHAPSPKGGQSPVPGHPDSQLPTASDQDGQAQAPSHQDGQAPAPSQIGWPDFPDWPEPGIPPATRRPA